MEHAVGDRSWVGPASRISFWGAARSAAMVAGCVAAFWGGGALAVDRPSLSLVGASTELVEGGRDRRLRVEFPEQHRSSAATIELTLGGIAVAGEDYQVLAATPNPGLRLVFDTTGVLTLHVEQLASVPVELLLRARPDDRLSQGDRLLELGIGRYSLIAAEASSASSVVFLTVVDDEPPVVEQISASNGYTCSLLRGNSLRCRSFAPGGRIFPAFPPALLDWLNSPERRTVLAVSAGLYHICWVEIDGKVRCAGDNSVGQLDVPADLPSLPDPNSLVVGGAHSCVLDDRSAVHCWGANHYGQLDPPADLPPVAELHLGDLHSCAWLKNGHMRCWGANFESQLTIPGTPYLGDPPVFLQVSVGSRHNCALALGRQTRCSGQPLWLDTATIEALEPGLQISANGYRNCLLHLDNRLHCWGSFYGIKGAVVARLAAIRGNWGGGTTNCVSLADGAMRCWDGNPHDFRQEIRELPKDLIARDITMSMSLRQLEPGDRAEIRFEDLRRTGSGHFGVHIELFGEARAGIDYQLLDAAGNRLFPFGDGRYRLDGQPLPRAFVQALGGGSDRPLRLHVRPVVAFRTAVASTPSVRAVAQTLELWQQVPGKLRMEVVAVVPSAVGARVSLRLSRSGGSGDGRRSWALLSDHSAGTVRVTLPRPNFQYAPRGLVDLTQGSAVVQVEVAWERGDGGLLELSAQSHAARRVDAAPARLAMELDDLPLLSTLTISVLPVAECQEDTDFVLSLAAWNQNGERMDLATLPLSTVFISGLAPPPRWLPDNRLRLRASDMPGTPVRLRLYVARGGPAAIRVFPDVSLPDRVALQPVVIQVPTDFERAAIRTACGRLSVPRLCEILDMDAADCAAISGFSFPRDLERDRWVVSAASSVQGGESLLGRLRSPDYAPMLCLELTLLLRQPSLIGFSWRSSLVPQFLQHLDGDAFRFLLDDVPLAKISDDSGWQRFSTAAAPGTRRLRWCLEKGFGGFLSAQFENSVWLDALSIDSPAVFVRAVADVLPEGGDATELQIELPAIHHGRRVQFDLLLSGTAVRGVDYNLLAGRSVPQPQLEYVDSRRVRLSVASASAQVLTLRLQPRPDDGIDQGDRLLGVKIGNYSTDLPEDVAVALPTTLSLTVVDDEAPVAIRFDIADDYGCAVLRSNRTHCWWRSSRFDETGPLTALSLSRLPPAHISPGLQLALSLSHACWLSVDGVPRCVGHSPSFLRRVPSSISDAVSVRSGDEHSCVLRAGGAVSCWGTGAQSYNPVFLLRPAVRLVVGDTHSCAQQIDGQLRCWNARGYEQTDLPASLRNGRFVLRQLSAGHQHSCGLSFSGGVRCWGDNSAGQAEPPADLWKAVRISTGLWHSCAVSVSGSVRCWGGNANGETSVPPRLQGAVDIVARETHSCARLADGALRCWGGDPYFGDLDIEPDASGLLGLAHAAITMWLSSAHIQRGERVKIRFHNIGGASPGSFTVKFEVFGEAEAGVDYRLFDLSGRRLLPTGDGSYRIGPELVPEAWLVAYRGGVERPLRLSIRPLEASATAFRPSVRSSAQHVDLWEAVPQQAQIVLESASTPTLVANSAAMSLRLRLLPTLDLRTLGDRQVVLIDRSAADVQVYRVSPGSDRQLQRFTDGYVLPLAEAGTVIELELRWARELTGLLQLSAELLHSSHPEARPATFTALLPAVPLQPPAAAATESDRPQPVAAAARHRGANPRLPVPPAAGRDEFFAAAPKGHLAPQFFAMPSTASWSATPAVLFRADAELVVAGGDAVELQLLPPVEHLGSHMRFAIAVGGDAMWLRDYTLLVAEPRLGTRLEYTDGEGFVLVVEEFSAPLRLLLQAPATAELSPRRQSLELRLSHYVSSAEEQRPIALPSTLNLTISDGTP